jgi:hypothetical protein
MTRNLPDAGEVRVPNRALLDIADLMMPPSNRRRSPRRHHQPSNPHRCAIPSETTAVRQMLHTVTGKTEKRGPDPHRGDSEGRHRANAITMPAMPWDNAKPD